MTAPAVTSSLRKRSREDGLLVRSVGPAASVCFSALPRDLRELVARESHSWRWDCGEGGASHRRYRIPPGARSLADLALSDPGLVASWSRAISQIGAALCRLHGLRPASDPVAESPQGLRRVGAFLTGSVLDGRPTLLRDGFVDGLRPGLLDELIADCRHACRPRRPVRSHGWAGLGRWYPLAEGAVGLVGEDLGLAAPEHDLAAVLAQVAELGFFRESFAGVLDPVSARVALLDGYRLAVDDRWLDREIRLGVVRHVADIVVHADCPDEEPRRWAELVGSLHPIGSP